MALGARSYSPPPPLGDLGSYVFTVNRTSKPFIATSNSLRPLVYGLHPHLQPVPASNLRQATQTVSIIHTPRTDLHRGLFDVHQTGLGRLQRRPRDINRDAALAGLPGVRQRQHLDRWAPGELPRPRGDSRIG